MATYTPPGWPAGVHPPGSDDFESTAVGWLLDVVPPDYRLHGVLRRYPVALATMARYHSRACVEGAREGYRTARTELAGTLPPHAIDTVLAAYRKEGARLAATARAVGLVERALRGEVFTPKMSTSASKAANPKAAAPKMADPKMADPKMADPKMADPKMADPKMARRRWPIRRWPIRRWLASPTRKTARCGRPPGPVRRSASVLGASGPHASARQRQDRRRTRRTWEERPVQNMRRWHQASQGLLDLRAARGGEPCHGRPGSFWSTTGART